VDWEVALMSLQSMKKRMKMLSDSTMLLKMRALEEMAIIRLIKIGIRTSRTLNLDI
jgi:hypothetical protein